MRTRTCRGRGASNAGAPYLAAEMWTLSDNPNFVWFCQAACLADDYASIDVRKVPCLALRIHLPTDLGALGLTAGVTGTNDMIVQFATLRADGASIPLWRCNMHHSGQAPAKFAVAGGYDQNLLNEFRRATMLLFVQASVWLGWDLANVFLAVPNDREYWLTCTTQAGP
jgi:hypothetical protein